MSNKRLLELMSRRFSGEILSEELQELDLLLSQDPDAQARYKLMQQFWEQHDNIHQSVIEDALQKTLQRLDLPVAAPVIPLKQGARSKWFVRVGAAAAIIIVAGLAFFFLSARREKEGAQAALVEKQNSKGVKSTIELTDGSKIWLNADSKIQYPTVFTGNTREVYMNGEAFFEVAKDPSRPFIIHLSNGTVKVLGTSFNIRAYDNEKTIEASVATGRIAFIPKYEKNRKKQDTVFLTPDNKARYLFYQEEVITEPTISREDKAWTEGKLIFKAMTLEDICTRLERNFGKKVVFVSDRPRQFRLTGSFQNNSLEDIMYYLHKSMDFNYKITDTELLIGDKATALPE
jgi:ferric-dicitrate binding protein FerR (iron transport regulator)